MDDEQVQPGLNLRETGLVQFGVFTSSLKRRCATIWKLNQSLSLNLRETGLVQFGYFDFPFGE
jgi:hypothetical protein